MDHRPQISAAQLSALVAVAECGSVSRAALDLQLAQSSVSSLILNLEAQLGAPVLLRGPRGTQLTPLGERVCGHARHALNALDAIVHEARAQRVGLQGTLRVIACRSAARHLVLPTLPLLRAQHPGIEVSLADTQGEHDEVVAAVQSGTADVGFGRLPMNGLETQSLVADEFLVVRRQGAPAPRGWRELEAGPLLLADQDCAPRLLVHAARQEARLRVARALRDPHVLLEMVRSGEGVTILSGLVLHPLANDLAVSPLPTPLWRELGWAVHPSRRSSPLVAAYLALLSRPDVRHHLTGPIRHLVQVTSDASAVT